MCMRAGNLIASTSSHACFKKRRGRAAAHFSRPEDPTALLPARRVAKSPVVRAPRRAQPRQLRFQINAHGFLLNLAAMRRGRIKRPLHAACCGAKSAANNGGARGFTPSAVSIRSFFGMCFGPFQIASSAAFEKQAEYVARSVRLVSVGVRFPRDRESCVSSEERGDRVRRRDDINNLATSREAEGRCHKAFALDKY
ncbi:hypothetical protein SKAU_G00144020 [Synaphobranchus kaupii]|uniref:Uncharacterized protein n=1 Tax=Synaphobranchus kaupii TaxID=118154 RepID=A0A9Q1J495_SYNKA|nr:hypothetical protein SKAU_G00144020 [Synaphobranchus kaupii]